MALLTCLATFVLLFLAFGRLDARYGIKETEVPVPAGATVRSG